jgi:hypothetical protein
MARVKPKPEPDRVSAVAAYKTILKRIVDNRPSGTRHRLADGLGKNRSFISQITSPSYSVPIPPGHIETIFQVCHFTPGEKEEFLAAYNQAHTRRLGLVSKPAGNRSLTLTLPDLGSARRNRLLDEAIVEMARRLARLTEEE